ncbi:MAG: DUF4062 domain-containing protein [Fimbriiglobus sp.]
MPYTATVLKVMIASPGDVSAERQAVRDTLTDWNHSHSKDRSLVLMPVGWETDSVPEMGDRPQGIINKQILADCDLLVAIFWTRLGTPTGVAPSGTAEEIEEHLKAGKKAMLYFSSAPVKPDSLDTNQYAALKKFKDECRSKGLLESYDSSDDFGKKFRQHLAMKINEMYPSANITSTVPRVPQPPTIPTLSAEAKKLLITTADDRSGRLTRSRLSSGLRISTNGQRFNEQGNARSEARWEAAIAELENLRLLEDLGHKREVFSVTDEGYRVVDLLRGAQP